jgi:hypothetical protein
MAYATVAEFRQYVKLPSATSSPPATNAAVTEQDALLGEVLDRATSLLDEVLGFSFAAYPGSATAKSVPAMRSQYLTLPPHQSGSITSVVDGQTTIDASDYTVLTSDDGRRVSLWLRSFWSGERVTVTAKWGYGPAPDSIVEMCLELAVNIWRAKDRAQFADAIGVDPVGQAVGGGAVAYGQMFTKTMRAAVEAVRSAYRVVSL